MGRGPPVTGSTFGWAVNGCFTRPSRDTRPSVSMMPLHNTLSCRPSQQERLQTPQLARQAAIGWYADTFQMLSSFPAALLRDTSQQSSHGSQAQQAGRTTFSGISNQQGAFMRPMRAGQHP